MINQIDPTIQEPYSAGPRLSSSYPGSSTSQNSPQPVIEVSECDGRVNVYADFRPVLEHSTEQVVVKFARQGMILAAGTVQRYLPIPTDALVLHARVTTTDGVARISIPTADSGHRWRSIVMW